MPLIFIIQRNDYLMVAAVVAVKIMVVRAFVVVIITMILVNYSLERNQKVQMGSNPYASTCLLLYLFICCTLLIF